MSQFALGAILGLAFYGIIILLLKNLMRDK